MAGDRPPPPPGHDAFCAEALTAGYGAVVALEDITLTVPYGRTVAVLGPNGSGKSSLFAAAVGLLRPWRGRVAAGEGGVAWLPQRLEIDRAFPVTVEDVALMGRWGQQGADWRRWLRAPSGADHDRVADSLRRLGITDLADRRLGDLSGGQRQRALIAQVMVQDAGLVLLDEPFSGVDHPTRTVIHELVAEWRDEDRAVMVATHDLEAAREYDLVLALDRRVVAFGPPSEVCTEEVLRTTFRGHVARVGARTLVDTAHHHEDAS